jgi:disulfide oxidoreductase YuzD
LCSHGHDSISYTAEADAFYNTISTFLKEQMVDEYLSEIKLDDYMGVLVDLEEYYMAVGQPRTLSESTK